MTADLPRTSSGLGRGLAALIPQRADDRSTVELPIAAIARNPFQPRQSFEQAQLDELAASIREHGVLQPILVTETAGGYRLIAGERRLRAAEMAGLERIPALVRPAQEAAQLEWALIENLQRTDLNPLEEAAAFKQLAEDFGLTHEEIALRVGRSRSGVANTVRLLDLAPEVQNFIRDGRLSEGHARAIAGLADHAQQAYVAGQALLGGLSVRQTEELVRRLRPDRAEPRAKRERPADVDRLEAGLRDALATKVTISTARRGGRITIEYYSEEELERLYERLARSDS